MDAFYFVLGLFFQTVPVVIVVVLAFAFIFFCLGAYNSPLVAVWAACAVYLLKQLGGNVPLSVGLNLDPVDFYFLLLGLVFVIRLLAGKLPAQDRVVRLWLLMAVVWMLLFVVGLAQFKSVAGVEFRGTYYMLVTTLYFMTFRINTALVGRIFQALYALALVLVGLAIYRWISSAMGEFGPWYDPVTPLRVLDSGVTLVIAVAMLPGLVMWMKLNTQRTAMMITAPLLLLAVMVLGHRTVWVVSLAALGCAWWMAGRRQKGGQAGLLVPLAVGALVIGGLFALAPQSTVTQEFQRSVAEAQGNKSTLAWRVDSWKSLVSDWAAGGPLVWPAGKPFGNGYRRFIESQGMETTVGAHSHYVTLLVRGGLLVLFAYVAAQILVLRRLLSRPIAAPDWLGGELPALFVIANMVYAISYSPDFMQAFFLGLAYVLAVQAGPQPSTTRAPIPRVSTSVTTHAPRRLPHLP